MKMPYCSKCGIGEGEGPPHVIRKRQRVARAVAGLGCLALAWTSLEISTAKVTWPLTLIAAWFGVSHVVAAWTAYPDCPELGAIASLVSRRYIRTRCGPWALLDKWLESRE